MGNDVSNTEVIHSFIHQWLYSPLSGPGLLFSFVFIFTQTAGLLGRPLATYTQDNTDTE
jgi:hypothetical protein